MYYMSRKNDEDLVEKPNSHEKTLESIKEWATYGERKYVRSRDKLSFYSLEDLKEKIIMALKLL